jgi:peptide/nickel transport system substrate-binding protein
MKDLKRRPLSAALALILFVPAASCTRGTPAPDDRARSVVPFRGGALTAAIRDDPATFNPYVGRSTDAVEVLTRLLHASLVRIDRRTGEVTPWLADHWTASDDRVTWTIALRKDVCFSDGTPFKADDVVFAFAAVNDPAAASAIGDSLLIDGRPITAVAVDDATVMLRFPAPPGAGLQILDNLPILPRHKLESALRHGHLKDQWTIATAPSDVVGLGPFRLAEYRPGEEVVVERNPFYWRADKRGVALPYLDRLTLTIVRDLNTELLRIRNGQIDIGAREIRPEDYAALRRDEDAGRVRLADAGVSLDPNMLWFNLSAGAYANDSRKPWLQSGAFRKAISYAVNRQGIVDQVFLGAAVPVFGPVTPGNQEWYAAGGPLYEYDPPGAATLLQGLGLEDRNGDGIREDSTGRPVRFSVLTQQQDTIRMRTLAVVQEQLRRVGITIDIVGVDRGMIIRRWSAGDYDAIYFGVEATSYDPADNLDFWLSSGSFHLWNAGQRRPATDWERRIDDLMRQQAQTADRLDRQRLFGDAQRILADQQPVICFAAPRLVSVLSMRVANATPAPLRPIVLWNAESLAIHR